MLYIYMYMYIYIYIYITYYCIKILGYTRVEHIIV